MTAVGGLFFPQSKSLGIDRGEASPALLEKIVFAGTASRSFAEASALLEQLAELTVQAKQVERVTRRIGAERVAERDTAVTAFRALPLAEKFGVPAGVTPPEVAVVMADGGRLQIRDAPEPTTTVSAPPPADTAAEAWEEEAPAPKAGHWREDKAGALLSMQSVVADGDPCPEIPASFLDVVRIPRLVRELKRDVKEGADAAADSAEPETADDALQAEATYQAPVVQHRQVVATRGTWRSSRRNWPRRPGQRGSRGRRARPSSAMGRPTTGGCSGASSGRSCRSWISSTLCRTCLRRPWRGGGSRPAWRVTGSGSRGCGRGRWRR